ncbi:hypothetical protein BC826DRAFT_361383 [Russula brevipes]|nr:hypothetical protein BC826DRAFT_361383 [Russula brevipes]
MSFIVTMTQYGAGRTPVDVATRPSVVFLVDLLMRLQKNMYDLLPRRRVKLERSRSCFPEWDVRDFFGTSRFGYLPNANNLRHTRDSNQTQHESTRSEIARAQAIASRPPTDVPDCCADPSTCIMTERGERMVQEREAELGAGKRAGLMQRDFIENLLPDAATRRKIVLTFLSCRLMGQERGVHVGVGATLRSLLRSQPTWIIRRCGSPCVLWMSWPVSRCE